MKTLAVGVPAYDAHDDCVFTLRAHAAYGMGDIPAVVKGFLCMKGPNAFCPCRDCFITGISMIAADDPGRTEDRRGNQTLYIPTQQPPQYPNALKFDPRNLPLRTHEQFIRQALAVDQAQTQAQSDELARQYGINGTPLFSTLHSLSFPDSFPADFMHLLENILKNMISFWTNNFKGLGQGNGNFIISEAAWKEIGESTTKSNASIPSSFGRSLPDIYEDRSYFTAEAYIIWFTMHAPILLRQRFGDEKYYRHLCQLVSLINLTMSFDLSEQDLKILEEGWIKWYEDYERYASLLCQLIVVLKHIQVLLSI
ncbi:hypothetical protein SISSUDRAFT_991303 [Sistotremastrum suecicum HHB10207 ss-3]|uniref:Uncharacterized protein n=1 Tax=Sistotremastrum suecicum HHB10207 ss-3 TaxID=1314776 RepID=A0A166A0X5_9AGAM|nr:hypothetical protein SISSUDRAFT_991303 [Sistotremastrum suecicum HHB10207 ss-3]